MVVATVDGKADGETDEEVGGGGLPGVPQPPRRTAATASVTVERNRCMRSLVRRTGPGTGGQALPYRDFCSTYGVMALMCVDQLPSGARVPPHWPGSGAAIRYWAYVQVC